LVRYMFLMTPDEQRKLLSASPAPAATPAAQQPQKVGRNRNSGRSDWAGHHTTRDQRKLARLRALNRKVLAQSVPGVRSP